MKKIIISSVLFLAFCVPVYSYAQAVDIPVVESNQDLQAQLIQALQSAIQLLIQEVTALQAQLAQAIVQQNIQAQQIQQIINIPVPVSIPAPAVAPTPVVTPTVSQPTATVAPSLPANTAYLNGDDVDFNSLPLGSDGLPKPQDSLSFTVYSFTTDGRIRQEDCYTRKGNVGQGQPPYYNVCTYTYK